MADTRQHSKKLRGVLMTCVKIQVQIAYNLQTLIFQKQVIVIIETCNVFSGKKNLTSVERSDDPAENDNHAIAPSLWFPI